MLCFSNLVDSFDNLDLVAVVREELQIPRVLAGRRMDRVFCVGRENISFDEKMRSIIRKSIIWG